MQTYSFIAAIVLYIVCAALPSRRDGLISAVTLAAWLLHGAGLWSEIAAAA
jgi:hypothetical protein